MNVRTICLAILYEGPATGYEIRKLSVEGDYSYFIDASFGSIYPALAKLEAESLVASHVEQQEGKPAKKVYSITEAGRRAFIASLFEPLDDDDFKSEFLLFARFASELPASLVETRLKDKLAALDAKLAEMAEMNGGKMHACDCWVLNFGRAALGAARDYLKAHMGELIAQARPEASAAHAAE